MGRKSSNTVHHTMALESAPNVKVYRIGSQNCCLFTRLHEWVVDLFQRAHTWNNCKEIYCRSAAITGISTFELGLLWSQRPVFPSINECLLSSVRYFIADKTAFRNSCNPLAHVLLSASPALEQWHDYPSGSLNAPAPHKHNSHKRLFISLDNFISMVVYFENANTLPLNACITMFRLRSLPHEFGNIFCSFKSVPHVLWRVRAISCIHIAK